MSEPGKVLEPGIEGGERGGKAQRGGSTLLPLLLVLLGVLLSPLLYDLLQWLPQLLSGRWLAP